MNDAAKTPSENDGHHTIAIARQPILDREQTLVAYELLFRSPPKASAPIHNEANVEEDDADQATAQVILNTFSEIGLAQLIGNNQGFINFTANMLHQPLPFSGKDIVLEILEDVEITPQLIAQIKKLKQQGYLLALDDYQLNQHTDEIVPLVDIIKLDLMVAGMAQTIEDVKRLAPFGKRLLAEKVETHEEFQTCLELGFELFQGYFFAKPECIVAKTISPNKLSVLKLLANLQDPDISMPQLENIISADTGLSVKILKLFESAQFAQFKNVDSLKRALAVLGMTTIKRWASLMAIAKFDDQPEVLTSSAIFRAHMCLHIAQVLEFDEPDACFTVGLFSCLDALVDQPLESVINELPLVDSIKQALLEHQGVMGTILDCVKAYESGDFDFIDSCTMEDGPLCKLDATDIAHAYLSAIQDADSAKALL